MSADAWGGAPALLEREEPRGQLAALAAASLRGRGSLAAIVGAPGEGKTALLREAAALGERAGLRAWSACGSDLEGSFAFGIVRQLLQLAVMNVDRHERAEMFSGAARLAAGVLDLDERRVPLEAYAARQGLYWLLVDLARRGPLMLLVDDAHWADEPSLLWLASLTRRVEDLNVLVVVAARPPEFDGADGALAALLSDQQVPLLRVGALGRESIAELARRELDGEHGEDFVEACHRATGGNPLAVIELLRDLRRDGGKLDAERSARLGDRAPEAIARHVRGRLDRLGPEACDVARALAVLGSGSSLRQVAALARVEFERAGQRIDELTLAGIVGRAAELRFEHPLVHAAVRDSITHRRRAALHRRAATLLAEEHSDPESIAAHLLNAEPAGDLQSVAGLRAAGAAAVRRGSPDGAVTYLKRALAEPPPAELRSALLGELGRAVWAAFDTSAIRHLHTARELTADACERAGLDLMLAEVCLYAGERDRLFAVLERGLADLGDQDPELALELRAMRTTALAGMDAGWPADDDAEHEQLAELADPGSDTGRQLRLSLALVGIWTGRATAPETIAMVQAALDERMLKRADAGSASRLAHGLFALIFADELECAADLASRMMAAAAAAGSPMMLGLASHALGWAQLRRGALADAEASGRLATDAANATRARFAQGITCVPLGEALTERGRLEDATEVLTGVPSDLHALAVNFFMRTAVARLHRACGRREAAITELETLGQEARKHGMRNPAVIPWRSELALLIAAENPDRAAELVDSELADARRVELPRAVGVALRARAAGESGAVREATLNEAVASLEASPARLDLVRALIDLGAHLRRDGRRSAARDPLRRALELAHQCAAEPLIALAGDELRAADGRPRSPWLTGAAALTPSELRVARLAATGLSNQQVAETLFITIKTVEMHLTSAYRKLGGSSRAELSRLLEGQHFEALTS